MRWEMPWAHFKAPHKRSCQPCAKHTECGIWTFSLTGKADSKQTDFLLWQVSFIAKLANIQVWNFYTFISSSLPKLTSLTSTRHFLHTFATDWIFLCELKRNWLLCQKTDFQSDFFILKCNLCIWKRGQLVGRHKLCSIWQDPSIRSPPCQSVLYPSQTLTHSNKRLFSLFKSINIFYGFVLRQGSKKFNNMSWTYTERKAWILLHTAAQRALNYIYIKILRSFSKLKKNVLRSYIYIWKCSVAWMWITDLSCPFLQTSRMFFFSFLSLSLFFLTFYLSALQLQVDQFQGIDGVLALDWCCCCQHRTGLWRASNLFATISLFQCVCRASKLAWME